MVMGGAVNGAQYYGVAPELCNNGPDDIGRSRLLSTTSVEQMAATLVTWFGCSASEIQQIFPNIGAFDTADLGFCQPASQEAEQLKRVKHTYSKVGVI